MSKDTITFKVMAKPHDRPQARITFEVKVPVDTLVLDLTPLINAECKKRKTKLDLFFWSDLL